MSVFGAFQETEETRYREAVDRFRPRFTLEEKIQEDLLRLEQVERELQGTDVDPQTQDRILRDALARNTFGTVSIEGNPLTLTQVRSLLVRAPSPANAVRPEERDVLNVASFLGRLEHHDPPHAPRDLEHLHSVLFEGTVPDAGRFKQELNFIARHTDRVVMYVPTPPERVVDELERALEWFHTSSVHPVVRVAVFFHELQSIHPFTDGNGRLGRAVAALQLHHLGYPSIRLATVDFAINQDRDGYYDALKRSQGGQWDLTPWLRYWVRVLRESYEDAEARFLLRDQVPSGLDPHALEVAVWIARRDRVRPGRRLKFGDIHEAFPAVPRRSLQRNLRALVDAGVLVLQGRGRGAHYRLHPTYQGKG